MLIVDNVVYLDEINLHLLVELVGNTGCADIRGPWPRPFSAHWTRLDDVGNVCTGDFRDSYLLQELFHSEL